MCFRSAASQVLTRLIGFDKVELAPDESKRGSVATDPRLLASFDSVAKGWRIAGGQYAVSVGATRRTRG